MTITFNTAVFAVSGILTGLLLATATVSAAPEITINQPVSGSTTIVEQSSDGKLATITATPNGITMQDGIPFSTTQVTNVPRYTVRQGSSTVITTAPVVTIAPVTSQLTQQIDNTVVTMPVNPLNTGTQILAVNPNMPVITGQQTITPTVTNQITATAPADGLQRLQLNPTFSTPDVASAQTKIMKILKNSDGREFAVPANSIAAGDTIEYHTTYTNNTAQPVRDLNATVSLPNGVKLVSLNSPLTTMATTGGDSYQTIQQVGNSVVIQENYSGLKWNLVNLATNAPQTVVIRAIVQ